MQPARLTDQGFASCHLRKLLARFKVPKVIEFIPEFPLMPNGKVDRRALKTVASKKVTQ